MTNENSNMSNYNTTQWIATRTATLSQQVSDLERRFTGIEDSIKAIAIKLDQIAPIMINQGILTARFDKLESVVDTWLEQDREDRRLWEEEAQTRKWNSVSFRMTMAMIFISTLSLVVGVLSKLHL